VNYLIDTNIISEVRKGTRCNKNVAAWFASIEDHQLYLSVLVLGEIRRGIEKAKAARAPHTAALEQWLAAMAECFGDRILTVDRAVADEWGRMSAMRPVPTTDALLAATAKVHQMTLATRNIAHVADLGADVVNPFD
jgi:predicted nucleic acid-binding protein